MEPHIVSAFDAKTHLSQYLREVETGLIVEIRRRGKPVARLVPARPEKSAENLKEIFAAFRHIRKGIKGRVRVKDLVEEGRRY